NHGSVAVVIDPGTYDDVIEQIGQGGFTIEQRRALAAAAFRHTADYDIQVASWMGNVVAPDDNGSALPGWVGASWTKAASLRYGENPHQQAALYTMSLDRSGIANAHQLH